MGPSVPLARGLRSSRWRRLSPLPLFPRRHPCSRSDEAQSEKVACRGWVMAFRRCYFTCCGGPAVPRPLLGLLGAEGHGDPACTGRLAAAVGRRCAEGWLQPPPPPPPGMGPPALEAAVMPLLPPRPRPVPFRWRRRGGGGVGGWVRCRADLKRVKKIGRGCGEAAPRLPLREQGGL